MPVRLRERRSLLAVWAQRLSLLAVPVLIIAAFGHRAGMMDATPTYATMALGFALAAVGVIAALAAFEGIWRDGRKGVGPALRGLLLGLLILVVPIAGAWKLVTYPRLTDISTDLDDPPEYLLALSKPPGRQRAPRPARRGGGGAAARRLSRHRAAALSGRHRACLRGCAGDRR